MAGLDPSHRRMFLRFITGTPRLPIGGFSALRPRLTVVKKEVDVPRGGTPDAHLPSCSTCQVGAALLACSFFFLCLIGFEGIGLGLGFRVVYRAQVRLIVEYCCARFVLLVDVCVGERGIV